MGIGMTPQLHFDGDPGVAAGGAGKKVPSDWHKFDEPGVCQLVQFGSTRHLSAGLDAQGTEFALVHTKFGTTMVSEMFGFTLLLVSPQVSGAASNSL